MKKIQWNEYVKTQQERYLDEENNADNECIFCNERYEIWTFKSLNAGDSHYFSGEDEDFAMVYDKATGNEELWCECTLKEIINELT